MGNRPLTTSINKQCAQRYTRFLGNLFKCIAVFFDQFSKISFVLPILPHSTSPYPQTEEDIKVLLSRFVLLLALLNLYIRLYIAKLKSPKVANFKANQFAFFRKAGNTPNAYLEHSC